jgi:hypothetical protein
VHKTDQLGHAHRRDRLASADLDAWVESDAQAPDRLGGSGHAALASSRENVLAHVAEYATSLEEGTRYRVRGVRVARVDEHDHSVTEVDDPDGHRRR